VRECVRGSASSWSTWHAGGGILNAWRFLFLFFSFSSFDILFAEFVTASNLRVVTASSYFPFSISHYQLPPFNSSISTIFSEVPSLTPRTVDLGGIKDTHNYRQDLLSVSFFFVSVSSSCLLCLLDSELSSSQQIYATRLTADLIFSGYLFFHLSRDWDGWMDGFGDRKRIFTKHGFLFHLCGLLASPWAMAAFA
jgi:hypothetical protein